MLIGKQISGLFLLFSSKRVCCHCGARHNADLNLSGTKSECVIRLWAIGASYATTCRALFLILSIVCRIAFLVLASNILIKLYGLSNGGFIRIFISSI